MSETTTTPAPAGTTTTTPAPQPGGFEPKVISDSAGGTGSGPKMSNPAVNAAVASMAATTLGDAILGEDIDKLIALFDSDFKIDEVWDALTAISNLGRKATEFLKKLNIVKVGGTAAVMAAIPSHCPAHDPAEYVPQLVAELKAARAMQRPMAATGPGDAVRGIVMDKVLAALISRLAAVALQKLMDYLNSLTV